jgi:pSer/pThr/pTyr-binding forkhead associated (FHA) protein
MNSFSSEPGGKLIFMEFGVRVAIKKPFHRGRVSRSNVRRADRVAKRQHHLIECYGMNPSPIRG